MERALKLTDREPLVVVVLGPTASGKTALALEIARRFHGEIVNCDSVAMYRDFEIGTAKPTAAERAEIPHHLVDCVDPLADVTAGEYRASGRARALRDIEVARTLAHRQRRNGTLSPRADRRTFSGAAALRRTTRKLRARADRRGGQNTCIAFCVGLIPAADANSRQRCAQGDPGDRSVPGFASDPITELWEQGREPLRGFRILRLGLNPEREVLYARINRRAAKMFDDGLIAETERLLAKYGEQARPLASLGYKQAMQFLRGEMDRESALAAAQQAHRNYAKRQITWFRREPEVYWLAGIGR